MKVIARFGWDCGRMGDIDGLFVADKDALVALYGKYVYFGEVLGKHSEIDGTVEEGDITILSEDQEFIGKFIEIMGDGTVSGYNPLDYYEAPEAEEDA